MIVTARNAVRGDVQNERLDCEDTTSRVAQDTSAVGELLIDSSLLDP